MADSWRVVSTNSGTHIVIGIPERHSVSALTANSKPKKALGQVSHRRWIICALLFFATAINYTDRQVLGLLAPMLQVKIGWSETQYAYIGTSFLIAYALGLLFMGPLIDRVGTRLGYAIAIGIWSLAALAHALVQSTLGFGIVRFALGFGESGNFPAAIKTIAEWFPKKERALATGIFNSGTNAGATIAPLVVPWIALRLGWQFAFLFTGVFSAMWIVCWLTIYRRPVEDKRVSPWELEHILSDPPEPSAKIEWSHLLTYRQTWTFVLAKFLTDPIWWFFLFWLPKFLSTVHGVSLHGMGLPLIVIYNSATVGSIFGGWLAARLIQAGWTVNRARKTAMLVCAIAVLPVMLAARIQSLWGAVALISIAVAAHQGWSANLYTIVSDMFPKSAVASVVGMGSFGGAIGGALIATLTGFLLQVTHSYVPIFLIAGLVYLIALLVIQSLSPGLQPVLEV
jgi:MFS transporter, ACS family, hexuronate transporter